jgi:hypothetical protein
MSKFREVDLKLAMLRAEYRPDGELYLAAGTDGRLRQILLKRIWIKDTDRLTPEGMRHRYEAIRMRDAAVCAARERDHMGDESSE